jgi:hypothetical protein
MLDQLPHFTFHAAQMMDMAWSPDTFKTNVRSFLAILIGLAIGWQAVKAYAAGQKGKALLEVIIGVVLSLFVSGDDTINSLATGIKSILGF